VLAAASLSAGCAAGQGAAILSERSVVDGASAAVGSLRIDDVYVDAPPSDRYLPGDTAVLHAYISNQGTAADTLTLVRTSAAGDISISGTDEGAASAASSSASTTPSVSASAGSASASASATPSSSATSTAGQVSLAPGDVTAVTVQLRSLTQSHFAGTYIADVTFDFANAGEVTFSQVPIELPATATNAPPVATASASPGLGG
jgi:hypothetical protein